ATKVVVDGAYEIAYLFGGGNGKDRIYKNDAWAENPGADVGIIDPAAYAADPTDGKYGTGTTYVNIKGGHVLQAFGGSNMKGNVVTEAKVVLGHEDPDYCVLRVDEVFGAGNEAHMDGSSGVDMGCVFGKVDVTFGGARNADVYSDVVLNITSGSYARVFGGNDRGGTIYGSITVNVEETGCLPINIDELYGGGNLAPYTVENIPAERKAQLGAAYRNYPEVNVKSASSIGTVYGGGYGTTAVVTGNPHVNISMCPGFVNGEYDDEDNDVDSEYEDYEMLPLGTIGTVFGGGNQAEVNGDTYVNIGTLGQINWTTLVEDTESSDYEKKNPLHLTNPRAVTGVNILNNVYGGGNNADVKGEAHVVIGQQ
ncbi:MAG: hypothetical protein ILP04_02195, partial [Bacteroidales bacterium]|nr:hypothetical protein [Bacteroidales bacterium]